MYKLYTDASVNQPKESKYIHSNFKIKSAIAFLIIYPDEKQFLQSFKTKSSNINQQELLAVITGLKLIPENSHIIIYTDSLYVIEKSRQLNKYFTNPHILELHNKMRNNNICFEQVLKNNQPEQFKLVHNLAKETMRNDNISNSSHTN